MNKEIFELVDKYLNSIMRGTAGWTSHDGANYVYWSNGNDRSGATSYLVDARDLVDKNLLHVIHGHIELHGPAGIVEIPLMFDWKKIRRRIEDALRKSNN